MKINKTPVYPALAANFQHLLALSPYKTVYALDEAVKNAKEKSNDPSAVLTDEEKQLISLPSGRTLYNLQNGAQSPNTKTLKALVSYYNYLEPILTASVDEFLTLDFSSYYNRFCTCNKRTCFSGLYSCFYLTIYDSHPVGALLYLDFDNIRSLNAILITEISSDNILQDTELHSIIHKASAADADRLALKQAFLNYKGSSFSKERLQLMVSSFVEITNESLSITFQHIDDPKKLLVLGLNITRFIKFRNVYHGGVAIAFSNNNTIQGLAGFRMLLASQTHLFPISLKDDGLLAQLQNDGNAILHCPDQVDTLSYRFLSRFKKELESENPISFLPADG